MATKVEELRQAASQAWDAFSAEMAKFNDDNLPTEDQAAHVDTLRNAATEAQKAVRDAEAFLKNQATWQEQEEAMRRATANNGNGNPAQRPGQTGQPVDRRSLGQRFVEGQAFKDWFGRMAPSGQMPESVKGFNSGSLMSFRGFRDLEMNAALLTGVSDTSAGAMVRTQYYPELTELGRRPLTIRDIITNLQTDTDLIEYVRVTTETNNAAPVAEATAASGSSGVKPESDLAFEKVTTSVKTIAHWIPATKRALSDAAQLRGLIDSFLRYGLEEELEDQIVQGSGSGENFTGIDNTTGVQTQAYDTGLLKTARKARTLVKTVGRRTPNAYIMNPIDWEAFDLLVDNETRYYFGGPTVLGTPRLWGLPVIESEAVPQGKAFVGDFRTCVLWDREQANISISDSHSDFFIRNLVAILGEMRAAFGILKPNAIVEVDLTP